MNYKIKKSYRMLTPLGILTPIVLLCIAIGALSAYQCINPCWGMKKVEKQINIELLDKTIEQIADVSCTIEGLTPIENVDLGDVSHSNFCTKLSQYSTNFSFPLKAFGQSTYTWGLAQKSGHLTIPSFTLKLF